MGKITEAFSKLLIILIRAYKYLVSPLIGPCCRFHPTCSTYAIEAIQQWGFFHGGYFTLKRILRYHPWAQGGDDPIPENKPKCQQI